MKKIYSLGFAIIVLIISMSQVSCHKSGDNSESIEHQSYVNEVAENVKKLSPERKQQREKWSAELNANPIYHHLVDSATVSADYLPVLKAISDGIRNTYVEDGKTMFGISEDGSAPAE